MQRQIRNKNHQFRNQFRREQIEQFKRQVRDKVLESRLEKSQSQQLNSHVSDMIYQQDIDGLYDRLFANKHQSLKKQLPLVNLEQKNILSLLTLLQKYFLHMKCLLLLNMVITYHYRIIFLNKDYLDSCKYLVKSLYNRGQEIVESIISKPTQKPQKMVQFNGILGCLRTLIVYSTQQQTKDGYKFTQVIKQEYIIAYLFKWLLHITDNPILLIIFILIEYDMNVSLYKPIKDILNREKAFISVLLWQSNPKNNHYKSSALPSIGLANEFVKSITNKEILFKLVPQYLEASKTIYELSTDKCRFFCSKTFLQTLMAISNIFKKLSNDELTVNLSEMMLDKSYWIFSKILLQTEIRAIREVVYVIIRHAIHNLLINLGKLQAYLTESLINSLGQGVQQDNAEINMTCLQIFHQVYHYCGDHLEDTEHILQWINNYEIDTILQNLQYSQNEIISELAISLIKRKKSITMNEGDQMIDEDV